jgi:hypothetical protein
VATAVAAQGPEIPLPRQVIDLDDGEVDVTFRAVVVAEAPAKVPAGTVRDLGDLTGGRLLGECAVAIALGRRVLVVQPSDLTAARRVATTMAAILEARAT